jgi:DNA helicase-2/ATP-dependent DNA helicase PcrA
MPQSNGNKLVIASAGSGKTTFLVEQALSRPDKRIAILTYTNNNQNEIKRKLCQKYGGVPSRIDVTKWFTFLLRECARPYQGYVHSKHGLKGIDFPEGRSAQGVPYSATERYYFTDGGKIYADKISRFVMDCEEKSNGLVMRRLGDIYDEIFIDEFQDLSGYDLDLLEVLLKSSIRIAIGTCPNRSWRLVGYSFCS